MIVLENILSQQIVQRLGWTLVHFIWQAAAIALLLAILLRVMRKSTANLRYIFTCLALALVVLLPLITIQLIPVSAPYSPAHIEPVPVSPILPVEAAKKVPAAQTPVLERPVPAEGVGTVSTVSWKQHSTELLEPALPYIVLGWLVGVFGLSLWQLGGWVQSQRLRRKMVRQVDASLYSKLQELAKRLGVNRAVQLVESALVQTPIVVGWLRPVILLPASALTGLSTEQLEAILAHELAHIKRFDYLVNMLQTVVEILGFYHPAVWWVSHKIRAERENCCDDLAVSVSGDRVSYARALALMEEIRQSHAQLAVAASGGSLFARIRRLVGKEPRGSRDGWIPSAVAILLIVAMIIPTTVTLTAGTETKTVTEREEKPAKSLHQAAADGDIKQVRILLAKGADINAKDSKGCTPLFYAAKRGDWIMTKLLIIRGARVNVRDPLGDTPLHYAARQGQPNHYNIIKMLVKAGADVNARNAQGQTPAHVAVENSTQRTMHSRIFVELVRADLNVEAKDSNGNAVLHLVPQASIYPNGLRALINGSKDLNLPNAKGETPLHIAIRYGHDRMVRMLVARAQAHHLNIADVNHVTPLHIAALRGNFDLAQVLLSKGVNIDAKDKHGHIPAYFALRAAYPEVGDLLINRGTDVSSVWLTAYQGDLPRLKKLISAEFSAHVKDEKGFTLLHAAALGGHEDVVRYLLSEEADIQAETQVGWTALSYAAAGNHMRIVKHLQAKGADGGTGVSKLLPIVAERGYAQAVEMLVDLGADVNTEDGEPLQRAARFGHKEVVELLITRGADVNLGGKIPSHQAQNLGGKTPLHQAVRGNHINIAECLIAAGADVNAGKWTPLHEAAKSINPKMVRLLLSRGADVNKPKGGWTPLDQIIDIDTFDTDVQAIAKLLISHGANPSKALFIAAWYEDHFVPLLLNSGADVNARSRRGWTALHYTVLYDMRNVCEQLLAKGADINAQTDTGQSLLHLMIDHSHSASKDQVEFALDKGVNINIKDNQGWTALHHVVLFNRLDIAQLLIARGVDLSAKARDGKTALQLAQEYGHQGIVELLRKHGAKE